MKRRKKTDFQTALVSRDFWENNKIKAVCTLKDGYHIAVFYQRLAFASYNWGGWLKYSPTQNYNCVTFAAAFNEPIPFIRSALSALFKYELVKEDALRGHYIIDFKTLLKHYTSNALRVTLYRERHKNDLKKDKPLPNVSSKGKDEKQGITKALQKHYKSITKEVTSAKRVALNNPYPKSRDVKKNGLPHLPPANGAEVGTAGLVIDHSNETAEAAQLRNAEAFLSAYPKKGNKECKDKVRGWYLSHQPNAELCEKIIKAIAKASESEKWHELDGCYIPAPFNFLEREDFEKWLPIDLPPTEAEAKAREWAKLEGEMIAELKAHPERSENNNLLLVGEFCGTLTENEKAELAKRRAENSICQTELDSFADWKRTKGATVKSQISQKTAMPDLLTDAIKGALHAIPN